MKNFETISQEEAEVLLRIDVESAKSAVLWLINVSLTDGQFDGLVSCTYNLSSGALQCLMLPRKVDRQAHSEVLAQLVRWVWAGGWKLNELIRHRVVETKLY